MFSKGHKKLGGRKRDTPNKITKPIRQAISFYLENNWNDFEVWIQEIVSPIEKAKIFISLLEFSIPKLQRTTIEETEKEKQIEDDKLTPEERREIIIKLQKEIAREKQEKQEKESKL